MKPIYAVIYQKSIKLDSMPNGTPWITTDIKRAMYWQSKAPAKEKAKVIQVEISIITPPHKAPIARKEGRQMAAKPKAKKEAPKAAKKVNGKKAKK